MELRAVGLATSADTARVPPLMHSGRQYAHFLKAIGIEKNPAELYDFGRILGNVDAMLVTGGCDVDDHVSVGLERGGLLRCHGRNAMAETIRG